MSDVREMTDDEIAVRVRNSRCLEICLAISSKLKWPCVCELIEDAMVIAIGHPGDSLTIQVDASSPDDEVIKRIVRSWRERRGDRAAQIASRLNDILRKPDFVAPIWVPGAVVAFTADSLGERVRICYPIRMDDDEIISELVTFLDPSQKDEGF